MDDSKDAAQLRQYTDDYIAGNQRAADSLYSNLWKPVMNSVGSFLGADNKDCDDVAQDTIIAVLSYLKKQKAFSGNIRSFAVTIARNRCRDILRHRKTHPHQPIEPYEEWIADHQKTALDYLSDEETKSLLHQSLDKLSLECRSLIKALYFGGKSMESLRLKFGLKSVQAMYYRRDICLDNILEIFKKRFTDRSLLEGGG